MIKQVAGQPKVKNRAMYMTLDSYLSLDPHCGHTLAAAGISVVHSLHIWVVSLSDMVKRYTKRGTAVNE